MHIALCLASFQTSLRSRDIPRYRLNPTLPPLFAAAWLASQSCNPAGACFAYCVCYSSLRASLHLELRRRALRIALVLNSCGFRARAAALRCSAPHFATDAEIVKKRFPATGLRNKDLRYRPP